MTRVASFHAGWPVFLGFENPFSKVCVIFAYMAAKYMFHLIYRIYLIFDEKLIP